MEMKDMRTAVVEQLTSLAEHGRNIAIVVSDSTSTSKIKPFYEKYPDRVINVGIAEQNAVGVAAGLSLGGLTAFTANAAPFLIARSNEQVKNDVCYSNLDVKLLGLNAGCSYSNLGSTHHAIDDISIMRGLGNISIFAPCDSVEAGSIIQWAADHPGPCYIRMDSMQLPILHGDSYEFCAGEIDILRTGKKLLVFALGSVVGEAWDAIQKEDDEDIGLINMSSIRPCNRQVLAEMLANAEGVITVEEHSTHGGIGSVIADVMTDQRIALPFVRLGITEGHFAVPGPRAELRAHHGIDSAAITDAINRIKRKG
jgi:transketolase